MATAKLQALGDGTKDESVLDAVTRIIDREGLAGLSMTAIAAEAGLSRVTLHRRPATIDDYVIAVFGRVTDDLRSSMWPVLTGPGTAAERLRQGLEVFCRVAERHAGVMRALYGVAARPLPGQPERTTAMATSELFERLLRDGRLDGTLVTDDPAADAVLTLNATGWTYLHLRKAHRWDEDRARTRCVDLAMAQLLPPG